MQSAFGASAVLRFILFYCMLCARAALVVLLLLNTLHADINRFVRSVKVLDIKSLQQKIVDENRVIFETDVEIFVDDKVHLWADSVIVDKQAQTLEVHGTKQKPLLCEHHGAVILADKLFLNLHNKTGSAQNIKINVKEGFIVAAHAAKKSDYVWEMSNIFYTPCDSETPHWHIKASHACVRGGYFVAASGVVFKIGQVPVFGLPYIMLPLQGQTNSGFLMPRFFLDYQYGFGFKQEYYWAFNQHADTTLAFDWRDKRGCVFSDEIRFARSPSDYLIINAHYAIARDMLAPKGAGLFKRTKHRYWIRGEDFSAWTLADDCRVNRLARIDIGTDKRVGYHFFNTLNDVDNTFNSAFIQRFKTEKLLGSFHLDSQVTRQKYFTDDSFMVGSTSIPVNHEHEEHVTVARLPRITLASRYLSLADIVWYRHDFFIDHILFRHSNHQRMYYEKKLIDERFSCDRAHIDLLRSEYQGSFWRSFFLQGHGLSLCFNPLIQFRSGLKKICKHEQSQVVYESNSAGRGVYRLVPLAGASWSLPQLSGCSSNRTSRACDWFVQPTISWEYCPSFNQAHWYFMDESDRLYGKNRFVGSLIGQVQQGVFTGDLFCSYGYDFSPKKTRFLLDQSGDRHWLPFIVDISLEMHDCGLSAALEWDLCRGKLLQAHVKGKCATEQMACSIGYLYQSSLVHGERKLLSDVPHFFSLACSVALGPCVKVLYEGQFYAQHACTSQRSDHGLNISELTPLLHRIGIEYKNHCWAAYIGFEEKKYKEYGHNKTEHIFIFSVKFDSLGSFAKKVKNYGT